MSHVGKILTHYGLQDIASKKFKGQGYNRKIKGQIKVKP